MEAERTERILKIIKLQELEQKQEKLSKELAQIGEVLEKVGRKLADRPLRINFTGSSLKIPDALAERQAASHYDASQIDIQRIISKIQEYYELEAQRKALTIELGKDYFER